MPTFRRVFAADDAEAETLLVGAFFEFDGEERVTGWPYVFGQRQRRVEALDRRRRLVIRRRPAQLALLSVARVAAAEPRLASQGADVGVGGV